ncbi:hypothetical protein [Aurantimonas sp. 22II-16-19i]|uniref:hypothetical protein n=1 Tax=Aurantimonas sp. 22II-16-19i TaxID=1317114 RepID=UPI0009F7EE4E|nr:hypothetical protein [Aurantimonas sp. 22II-16-19i]ORE93242.1 hypothetical protein ATO4_15865 [Aurantimonas sp. 22II-16-19i]
MSKITDRMIRNYALSKGNLDVRIRHDGEVHVWGAICRERRCGWHLFGRRADLAAKIELELLDERDDLSIGERAKQCAIIETYVREAVRQGIQISGCVGA